MPQGKTLLLTLIWTASSYAVLTMDAQWVKVLVAEDGFFESATAIFFLAAACVFFYLYATTRSQGRSEFAGNKRNHFLILLGLFFVICCGEEISWGQRIFNLETPKIFKDMNIQSETNFHNLWIFSRKNADGTMKNGLDGLLTAGKLFSLFWFGFCLVIPLLDRTWSSCRAFFQRIDMPIVPLWIGLLFMLNYLVSKIGQTVAVEKEVHQLTEIKECNFAFLFLVVAVGLLGRARACE